MSLNDTNCSYELYSQFRASHRLIFVGLIWPARIHLGLSMITMRTFAVMMLAATLGFGQTQLSHPGQRSRAMLEQATKNKNPDVRKEAVVAMSLVGVKEKIIQSLDSMLDDHDVPVRLAVVSTLGDFKDERTVPLLKRALKDRAPEVDFAAGKALYRLHAQDGKQLLLTVISRESKASSGYLTNEKRAALRMLHTPTKLFIAAAEEIAGMMVPVPGFGVGLSSVQGILSDSASSARAAALLLLGRENDPAVREEVRASLSDKEWSVRAAAVHVIAMHPYPEFRGDLVALLDDKKEGVRFRAAAAYIRLESRPKGRPGKDDATHQPAAPVAAEK